MSMILEAILTTATPDGGTHIAPLGFRRENGYIVLSPFHPSRTLDNLRATSVAAISHPPACAYSPAASRDGAIGRSSHAPRSLAAGSPTRSVTAN